MSRYHVAITRHVKPGCEAEFERAVQEFAVQTSHEPGAAGTQIIGPLPGSKRGEYGLLRTFDSRADFQTFLASERFAAFQQRIGHLVEGDGERRELTGMEAFFRGFGAPPPRWKMALVTWLGVFPTVLLWSTLLATPLAGASPVLRLAATITATVVTLTWGVMPLLSRLFAGWIHSRGP